MAPVRRRTTALLVVAGLLLVAVVGLTWLLVGGDDPGDGTAAGVPLTTAGPAAGAAPTTAAGPTTAAPRRPAARAGPACPPAARRAASGPGRRPAPAPMGSAMLGPSPGTSGRCNPG
ncbi:MAG: hypothetical protein ACJ75K_20150, partial [Actinomycetes bacterium]